MRTFIALDVPSAFEDELAGVSRQLASVVEGRFLNRSTYHVTLAFLGDVDEAEARLAMDALDAACDGMEAPALSPTGLGTFGRPHDATLWLGLATQPALMDLAERVRAELHERGISFDSKAFRPHITLARRTRIPRGRLPELLFPAPAVAPSVTLYKSILDQTGATYKALYRIDF